MDMKRFFLYAIAIAALALAGCGGGTKMVDNGPDNGPPTPPTCMADPTDPKCTGPHPQPPVANPVSDPAAAAPAIADADGNTDFDTTRNASDLEDLKVDITADNPVTQTADTEDIKFAATDMTAADLSDYDYTGTIHQRTNEMAKMTDMVTVYNNRGDPTPTLFGEVHPLDRDEDNDEATGMDATELRLNGKSGTEPTAAVRFTQFVPPMGTASTMTMAFDEGDTITGMFDGAAGMYKCVAEDGTCNALTVLEGGKIGDITELSDWNFEPADGAMVPVADGDYLSFGYWVQATTDDDDETTYKVMTFAQGSMPYTGTLTNLEGEATYEGPSTGLYVHKTDVDGDNMGLVATSSGQFTAHAELTANFGVDGDVGDNFQNAINGTVSNFTDSNTGNLIEGWELTLNPAKFTTGTAPFTGTTDDGSMTPNLGQWGVSFFGPATDDDNEAIMPGSVAGDFNGHFANGHATGAFGATKQP